MSTQDIHLSEEKLTLEEQNYVAITPVHGQKRQNRFAIFLSLFSLYILWGSTYLGMRIAVQSIPPLLMAGTRFFLAGGLMLIFLRLRGSALPTLKEWGGSTLVAALLFLLANGGLVVAEQWVPRGLASVAFGAMPLWASLLAGLLGRWPTRREWSGLAVGFAGLLFFNLGNGFLASPVSMIILLLAPFFWALGSVWSQHLSLPKGTMASAAQLFCGGILLLSVGLLGGERITQMPAMPAIWAMVFLIIGGSWMGFTAYGYLLQHVQASLATSYAYVNPLVSVFLGIW